VNTLYTIGIWSLVVSFGILVVPAGISARLRLGITREIVWAAIRAAVQLIAVGYVLGWVFARRSPMLSIVFLLIMIAIAGINTQRRQKFPMRWLWLKASLVIAAATAVPLVFILIVVVKPDPWYAPHILIPLGGMIMGNAMTSVVLGLDRFYSGLRDRWRSVETSLTLGATSFRAALPIIQGTARASLLPIINNMMVMGLVHFPGMMTGQLTAGASPVQAARYQLMILYAIATANSLATLSVIWLGIRHFFTRNHQIKYTTLEKENEKNRKNKLN